MSKLLYYLKLKNNWSEQKLAERVPSGYFGSVKGETKRKWGTPLVSWAMVWASHSLCAAVLTGTHTEPTLYHQMQVPAVFC